MTYKEAHDWCLENEVTVFFHPKKALIKAGVKTIGKVQFMAACGGSAGDTLINAIENWLKWQEGRCPK